MRPAAALLGAAFNRWAHSDTGTCGLSGGVLPQTSPKRGSGTTTRLAGPLFGREKRWLTSGLHWGRISEPRNLVVQWNRFARR